MEGIGVVLLIIFAIASSINKRMIRSSQQKKRSGTGKTTQTAPEGAFQRTIRQFREAADELMGQEKPAPEPPSKPAPPIEVFEDEHRGDVEPFFRGSVGGAPEPAPPSSKSPVPRGEPVPVPVPGTRAALPWMNPNGLVQAVIAQEILTRPRTAKRSWQARRRPPSPNP